MPEQGGGNMQPHYCPFLLTLGGWLVSDGMQQKVVLKAMTLRGVGSYLKGARLEIRPLTILCGKNGSGKSTWLKMLNLLKDSQNLLPFALNTEGGEEGPRYGSYTNALVRMAEKEGERKRLSNYEEDVKYGPLGTIGLHFEATEDIHLNPLPILPDDIASDSLPQEFLWHGRCPKGAWFRLRIAHPRPYWPDDEGEELYDFVELRLNDVYTIRFKKRVDFTNTAQPPSSRAEPYQLSCSQAFLPGASKAETTAEVELAKVEEPTGGNGTVSCKVDPVDYQPLCQSACQRIRELLDMLLSGIFYLSAIRLPHDYDELEEMAQRKDTPTLDPSIRQRYVGRQGEMTIALEDQFAYNRMKATHPPFKEFAFETFVSFWLERLVETRVEMIHDPLEYQSLSDEWRDSDKPPNGFLIQYQPKWEPSELEKLIHPSHWLTELPYYKVDRFQHRCFGNLQPPDKRGKVATTPRPLSGGFHQIAPMIIQAGLMRRNELLAIENPEVHLHPKLQLDVTEFLMWQAKISKFVIIETHSDLVVRRVLRAILEEEIPQEAVRLYFADLEEGLDGYHYSRLNLLETNYRGQIDNWPKGFMDDDVLEVRRLLDAMYGKPSEEKDEGDE
jgi:ABC-type ATPase involved in cell division